MLQPTPPSLIVSTAPYTYNINVLESIDLTDEESSNPPIPVIKNSTFLRNVIALSYNYQEKVIYYSDLQTSSIHSVGFNATAYTTIADSKSQCQPYIFTKGSGIYLSLCRHRG